MLTPGTYVTANGSRAEVTERVTPRAALPYWTGTLDAGGPCSWDDDGRDLRGGGYEEWCLVARVDE
jgi:hypothetical protein